MTAPRVARAAFAISVGAIIAALLGWAVGVREPFTPDIAFLAAAYGTFAAVGALIVGRQPANRIGRLALLTGLSGSLSALADTWARFAEPVPGQDWAAWLAAWNFPMTLVPALFLILLFPTGRLASRRWAIVAALIAGGGAAIAVGYALTPTFVNLPQRQNPVGVPGIVGTPLEGGGIGWLLLVVGAIAAAVGLASRLRSARGVERQQLKWVAYAGGLQGLAWVAVALDLPEVAGEIAQYAVLATLFLIPVAAGIAILRYRLYDIDVVIRRTLVYGALVAILGAVYVALVVGLQAVLSPVTRENTAAVAVSTLAIAALFGPVRGRVRAIVDRHFYRSRYDAQRTLQQFASRLRDEVELEAVGRSLTVTTARAIRPASVSLWLRKPSS